MCVGVHLHVWVHAGHPVCSLLAPGGALQLLVHFKLILLMLSSFVLLSLSVNLSFCLEHHMYDSYPVNSQLLNCPHCHPKLPLEKELTAACQGKLWRFCQSISLLWRASADSVRGKVCQAPCISALLSEGCHQALCLHYALHCRCCFGVVSSYSLPCHFSAD